VGRDSSPPAKRPYCDPDAERAVLGICLIGKADTAAKIRALLPDVNPFFYPLHAAIWRCICALLDAGAIPDWLTVADRMPEHHPTWGHDDRLLLVELYEKAPLEYNPAHARLVADYAVARTIVEVGTRIAQAGTTVDQGNIGTVLESVRQQIGALSLTGARQAAWHDLLIDGAAFALDVPPATPRIWGNSSGQILWARGESLMLVGPAGVGKSTLAGQLVAGRLGLIADVLGFPIVPGEGKVLIIAADRPAQLARSLRRTLGYEHWRKTLQDKLVVWRGPPPGLFSQRPTLLKEMADDAGADTVVLDSLKDVAVGLNEDGPSAMYNRARQLYLTTGRELIEIHHQTKHGVNGSTPTELSNVYGNQQLTAGAGSVVLLWGRAGDPLVRLTHLKVPQYECGPMDITHDHQRGMSSFRDRTSEVMEAAGSLAGITPATAAERFYDAAKPTPAQIARAKVRLDLMVEQGRLVNLGRGSADTPIYHAAARSEEPN
jgi:replicative DNA helicase